MMMSMIKRIFALLLTVAMLVCVLAACSTPSTPVSTGHTPLNGTTNTTTTESSTATTQKQITSVNITCGTSAIENFAATELKWYFAQKNIALDDNGYTVAVTIDASIPTGGYKISADDDGLVIAGGNERGLAYGLYAFLEKCLGVFFYSSNSKIITGGDVTIGYGVLDTFDPAFEIVRNPWYPIEQLPEKNGGNIHDNSIVKTFNLNALVEGGSALPCLSVPENVEKAIKKVRNYLLSGAAVDVLRFLPDAYTDCTCDDCVRILDEEGSASGIYVRFLNALSEAISPRFPEVKIELVVRDYLQQAPTLTKLADGISVRLSTENCHISHPFTDESCPEALLFANSVRGWSETCNNVYVDYVLTSTTDYIPTFANLGTLRENIRFLAECGIESIAMSGNFACPSGEFGELRVYLTSKLLQNPTMSEEEYYAYMDSFLKNFYGEGWEYIRKFIDKTIELAADGHQTASGNPFDAITVDEYLDNEETFDEWWNQAEALAGDRADFVKRARYQWRYIKLCLHPDAEEAQKLIADTSDSFNTRVGWREKQWNVDTNKSDLNLPPTEWIYKS